MTYVALTLNLRFIADSKPSFEANNFVYLKGAY